MPVHVQVRGWGAMIAIGSGVDVVVDVVLGLMRQTLGLSTAVTEANADVVEAIVRARRRAARDRRQHDGS